MTRETTHALFAWCVRFLTAVANRTGASYEAVNVWVFLVAWPLLTVTETLTILWLVLRRTQSLDYTRRRSQ